MKNIPEADWKYLRTIMLEMLETLCKRINNKALQILTNAQLSDHEKFLGLHEHVIEKNEIIARCFDDWRRSNILIKLLALKQERLLTDKHAGHLSEETLERIAIYERLAEE
jgi:hypothetical protein